MNLLIVLSENRRVLPWAQAKAGLVTNRAFNVTFVNCMAPLLVCSNAAFPRTWRSPWIVTGRSVLTLHGEHTELVREVLDTQCLICSTAWICMSSPMQSLCSISPEKFCFSVFLALLSNVLSSCFPSSPERSTGALRSEWEAQACRVPST